MCPGTGRCLLVVLATVGLAVAGLQAQKGPALPDVLKIAGDYLVQYSEKISGIAAEEEFLQYETTSGKMDTPKRVSSDFVLYGSGDGTVTAFRDVFAVDTVAVRQRDDRLPALFKHPTAESGQQARQLSEDSVRAYLNPNLHVLDQPTVALDFLRKENQERSTFKIESLKNMNGAQVAVLKFNERSTPRLIPSNENSAAVGRFWVDVATGAVRQTELGVTGKSTSIRVTVKYEQQPTLELWLPVEMYQQFELSVQSVNGMNNMGSGGGYTGRQTLEGRATYSKYRTISDPRGFAPRTPPHALSRAASPARSVRVAHSLPLVRAVSPVMA